LHCLRPCRWPSAERIRLALNLMGLADAADKLVRTYSGGMIRRLEIAQSTLHHPSILFLDEPTVGLDPVARKAVWELIERLRTDFGTTIFLTTHFMEEADSMCSRVAIMHLGNVVNVGAPADLKASLGDENATLDDVFVHYAGNSLDSGGTFRDTSRTRRTAQRLG
ncbi:MAG TPA: ATP-binding cassette domain-containing protein, partial [Candidatus Sumerlaeia bacterium]|nr:ATP-binding cassette domain-containing protein [Candidatus Sumerlaeia bacterium]